MWRRPLASSPPSRLAACALLPLRHARPPLRLLVAWSKPGTSCSRKAASRTRAPGPPGHTLRRWTAPRAWHPACVPSAPRPSQPGTVAVYSE
eukprot:scaffold2945_cov244-Pinguiococcus_pyrenoidosus.AAC.5